MIDLKRILIVDDDPDIHHLLRVALQEAHHQIESFSGTENGTEWLKNGWQDVYRGMSPLTRFWVDTNVKGTAGDRALGNLPMVVVSQRTVVSTSPHAALLERYARRRAGRGRSCQASQQVPSRHVPRDRRV
jgi:CheY-like chemotaxis protein